MTALLRQMLADAPAGLWPLQEAAYASGSAVADVSGNARHGACRAGVNMVPTADPRFGRVPVLGASASGQVDFGDVAAYEGPDATVTFWAKPSAVAQAPGVVVSKYDGSSSGHWTVNFAVSAGGVVTTPEWYWFQQGSFNVWRYVSVADPAPPAAGVWGFYAMVADSASNVIVYRNAVEVGRNTNAATGVRANASAAPLVLGAYGSGAFDFVGAVSHLAVFPSALTADRIAAHYKAGLRAGVAY